jgi:hypothetical protein
LKKTKEPSHLKFPVRNSKVLGEVGGMGWSGKNRFKRQKISQ